MRVSTGDLIVSWKNEDDRFFSGRIPLLVIGVVKRPWSGGPVMFTAIDSRGEVEEFQVYDRDVLEIIRGGSDERVQG